LTHSATEFSITPIEHPNIIKMTNENKNGSIVIVGATGTIASDLARKLTAQGQALLLIARNSEKLEQLVTELQQPSVCTAIDSSSTLEEAIRNSSPEPPRAIVNCIGSVLLKSAHATSDEEFRQTIETNLFTSFACVKAAGRLLRSTGGSVILFASAAAEIGIANHEAIAAAKAGVIGLARSAAASYASSNIRFNVVSPGLVRTELTKRIWQNEANAQASAQMHALGRLGDPAHITSLVLWLLDTNNDWITGQVIGVDGGLGKVLSRR
jgi:3-oxoacyl-[acyl-carrier protein] reductase